MFRISLLSIRLAALIPALAIVFFVSFFSGCTMETEVTGNVPTNVQAFSIPPSSVKVTWTPDPTDTTTDTVLILNGQTIVATATVPYPHDSVIVPGLTSGFDYTIVVGTTSGRSSPINFPFGVTNIPTNVTVISQTDTIITVGWLRTPTDTISDTLIVLTSTGGLIGNVIIVPAGDTTGIISGVQPGQSYIIIIASATGRSSAISYTVPGLAYGLSVDDLSASSMSVKWTRGVNDYGYDTTVVFNTANGVVAQSVTSLNSTPSVGSICTVPGLQEGILYGIAIHTSSGISDTLDWMTAERYTGIQLYAINDTNASDPTGLTLAANAVKSFPLSSGTIPDLVLDTNGASPSGLMLAAASVANSAWKDTRIAEPVFYPSGLDADYHDTTLLADTTGDTNYYNIPADSSYLTRGSAILTCQTASGNFVLIEIVPDSAGKLFSVSNGNMYITMNISYQSTSNAPYAGRGRKRGTVPTHGTPNIEFSRVNLPNSVPIPSTVSRQHTAALKQTHSNSR